MTMAYAEALQRAVYARLSGDAALGALVGDAIYDAPPERSDVAKIAHLTLGEDRARPFDTKTSRGARHEFAVGVHSGEDGFATAKRIAAAVCDALVGAPLSLERGHLVSIDFVRATAERAAAPAKRAVTLLFRAVIDQDG
ncbi:MAG: DUF3168 domain-containing protein [Rhodovulum sulfidophilum]|uniref:DUF3168 domain-containing protein n=1 Tax=Rhodovulum sulfidophilum TaxID=35806 RepID=A0A2W5QA85_RHOSU|nr:MAG: DUF3168 domain-containing protein [Rhodovulum sulfidophilum]